MLTPALSVRGLEVSFGARTVLRDVSFDAYPGRVLAIVGASGAGKSVTSRALVGLVSAQPGTVVRAESLVYRHDGDAVNLASATQRTWRKVRGSRVGLVLQDALVGLDPLRTVGRELEEAIGSAQPRARRRAKALELLERAGLEEPEQFIDRRADELSGGQRQRVLIATAIARDPSVIVADEPTASLDPVTRDQILDLLRDLADAGTAVVLISHDLRAIDRIADSVRELRDGRLDAEVDTVEKTEVAKFLRAGRGQVHRASTERGDAGRGETGQSQDRATKPEMPIVLEARHLSKSFSRPDGSLVRAVDDVSFTLRAGQTLGIEGQSGSGKTTLGRLVLGVSAPNAGEVLLEGKPWTPGKERQRQALRGHIGLIPQDALSSFDPRRTVGQILADALSDGRTYRTTGLEEQIDTALAEVGLPADTARRRPIFLSGGQRQRVAIARALAGHPSVLVADEAVSALDPGMRATVLDILQAVQETRGLAMLFISHDPLVTARMAHRVLRMAEGRAWIAE